jgi:hypothetical protein
MKPSFQFRLSAAAVLLTAAAFIVSTAAQAPQGPQDPAGNPPPEPRTFPAPANLKVLPRDLSGQQVHDIMEQWEAGLGIRCDSCHAEDPNNIGPNGRPQLNFASDSKPMKAVARMMYTMTEEINRSYVAKIDSFGAPVTCGTCHRGHLGPEPFLIPSAERPPAP